jgi:phosphoglycerate dehydrogenase-like enzyme
MCAMFGPVPKGVQLVPWSMASAPPRPEQINAVLVPNRFDVQAGAPLLEALPNLGFVQLTSAGYDYVLPLMPEGVVVSNGRGIHDDETAELAVGLLLASLRGIDVALKNMKARQWNTMFQPSLADRAVLLVGYGSIGKAIAARLEPFGVNITAVARSGRVDGSRTVHPMSSLPELLPKAEVVILSVPLTDETRQLVNAEFIDLLPRGARIINVARGAVVDTDALVAALTARRVFAALDVTDPEPLPERHPLWATPNTIITPHIGGHTTATQSRTLALFRRQVLALAEGRSLENVVS